MEKGEQREGKAAIGGKGVAAKGVRDGGEKREGGGVREGRKEGFEVE